MLKLASLPRAEFVSEWDKRREAEIAALDDAAGAEVRAEKALRIQFRYAQGRVMYPFFHWRESSAAAIEEDPTLGQVLSELPPIDARLWELVEVRDYVDARLHALARARLGADPELARGDARWLRAELRALSEVLPDERLWMRKSTDIIAKHVDDDGAGGIEEAIRDWRSKNSPPVLAVHGAADEYCPYADMARFAERYRAHGNPIDLVTVENASHFVGFFHEQGQRQQREAIRAALDRWDW